MNLKMNNNKIKQIMKFKNIIYNKIKILIFANYPH